MDFNIRYGDLQKGQRAREQKIFVGTNCRHDPKLNPSNSKKHKFQKKLLPLTSLH